MERCDSTCIYLLLNTLCKPRVVKWRVRVQPNKSESCGWWMRSRCALEEQRRYQQSPEGQTVLCCKTADEGDSMFLLHPKLPLNSSFYKNHFSYISYVEDHTLVCFSSCWLSVKLLLILRHHSTELKQFERNRDLVLRSTAEEY